MLWLIAAIGAFQASPVAPEATAALADARCIVIYGFVGSRGTPEQAATSRLATMFFAGKLRGRNPSVDMSATLIAATDGAKKAGLNARADGLRCETEFKTSASALLIGVRSTQSSQGQQTSPTPRKP